MSFHREDGSLYREAFGPFLDIQHWYSMHPSEEQLFFRALAGVVKEPDFNPDRMGEYFAQRFDLDNKPDDHPMNEAREHYVAAAWAVRGFLQATSQI